jgi:hypothetical protein
VIRALIGSLCAAIVVLAITAICLYGWGQRNANQALKSDRSLEIEKGVSSDLRVSLEVAQKSNSDLVGQLQQERELVQKYQVKTASLNKELLSKQETIRILEREDQAFHDWSNTPLPISAIGLFATAGKGPANRDNPD